MDDTDRLFKLGFAKLFWSVDFLSSNADQKYRGGKVLAADSWLAQRIDLLHSTLLRVVNFLDPNEVALPQDKAGADVVGKGAHYCEHAISIFQSRLLRVLAVGGVVSQWHCDLRWTALLVACKIDGCRSAAASDRTYRV